MILQLTAANSIMYFGARVLEEFDMSEEQTLLANVSLSIVAGISLIYALRNERRQPRIAHCSSKILYAPPSARWVEPRHVAADQVEGDAAFPRRGRVGPSAQRGGGLTAGGR
jgi:hypothetical protein